MAVIVTRFKVFYRTTIRDCTTPARSFSGFLDSVCGQLSQRMRGLKYLERGSVMAFGGNTTIKGKTRLDTSHGARCWQLRQITTPARHTRGIRLRA